MKVLYFDCFAGISGDMTLGALLDLGVDQNRFLEELGKINVDGFRVEFGRADKNGISAFDVVVILENGHSYGEESHSHEHSHGHHHGHSHGEENHSHEHSHGHHHGHSHGEEGHSHEHSHGHHHDHSHGEEGHTHEHSHEGHHHDHGHTHEHSHSEHVHRNLFDVNKIIDDSGITPRAKDLAKKIFLRVAAAEAKVHGKSLEDVHFHEVGALDSIVDIIGAAICIDLLNPDRIFSSVVNDGYGFIMCQHGQIPVPVPATAEIFANSDVIAKQIDIEMELVTPTGAAIIAELPESYGVMPQMKVLKTGYGAGKRSSKIPNVLRVVLGEGFED